jgi:hypothetical protein
LYDCSHRIQQNWVCIFFIFLRFSTNFQRFSKSTLLFENPTFAQAPGTFLPITDRPLVHEKTLQRMRETQCSPWALRAARLARIGRLRRRPWPGKRWGRTRGSPAVDLWPKMGGGALAAGRAVARREHGRGELYSGGLPAWEETRAAQAALAGSRGLREASVCSGVGWKGLLPGGAHWQDRRYACALTGGCRLSRRAVPCLRIEVKALY